MKNDKLYEDYLNYLDFRLEKSQISRGKWSLLKISKQGFESFKLNFENDEHFRNKIIKIKISKDRDKKISDIFDETN
jgi:hypothetical protein